MPKENNTTQMNDFVKPKDQRELALFGLARTEGVARAVPSSLGHCRVVTEEDKSNRAFKNDFVKPNEQSQVHLSYAMARNRTFKSTYIQAIKLTLILVTLALTACRSSRHASKDDTTTVPPSTIVTQPDNTTSATDKTSSGKNDKRSNGKNDKTSKKDSQDSGDKLSIAEGTNLTANVKIKVTQANKDMSTTGTLRMRYGEVIQITLSDPILGIAELGRMELSPNNILVIDRINKRYVSTDYEEFKALKTNNISFENIQEIFWKEAQSSDRLSYTIPASKPIKLDLQISGRSNSSKWTPHSTVSSRYTRTDVNKLFSSMMSQ